MFVFPSSRGIAEAIFAESGKIFSSRLLFIAAVRRGVKESAASFISFDGIVSIPASLFVSRHLIIFSISGGVTGSCPLNFFSICFMQGWVL